MAIEVQPPRPFSLAFQDADYPAVFLAGSIEMGKAIDWQQEVVSLMRDDEWFILNPRRKDWDATWKQDINNPQFYEQVSWELDGLYYADWVFVYFAPGTQSPISLLELGLVAAMKRRQTVVCCPEGFWRKGNVDIVCQKACIQTIPSYTDLPAFLRAHAPF